MRLDAVLNVVALHEILVVASERESGILLDGGIVQEFVGYVNILLLLTGRGTFR